MTDIDLNAIRERRAAITEGPWFYNGYAWIGTQDRPDPADGMTFDEWADKLDEGHSAERYGACPACETDRPTGCKFAMEWTRRETTVASVPPSYGDTATGKHAADARFIANAPTDVDALLAEVARLTEKRDALAAVIAEGKRLIPQGLRFVISALHADHAATLAARDAEKKAEAMEEAAADAMTDHPAWNGANVAVRNRLLYLAEQARIPQQGEQG